jgi:hypothetical protein
VCIDDLSAILNPPRSFSIEETFNRARADVIAPCAILAARLHRVQQTA